MTDRPVPAYAEDYDSDESSVTKPQSRASASITGRGKQPASSRPSHGRDAASDSGYSSHASPQLTTKDAGATSSGAPSSSATIRPGARPSQTSSKPPLIHRSSSTRSGGQRAHAASNPTPGPSACNDSSCYHPGCKAKWQYTLPHHPPPASPSKPKSQPQYPPQIPPQAQQPQFVTMGPPPIPTQRRRTGSFSQAQRPVSIGAFPMQYVLNPYDFSPHGPPPSSSAYYNNYSASPQVRHAPPVQPISTSIYPSAVGQYPPLSAGPLSPGLHGIPPAGAVATSARTLVHNPALDALKAIPVPQQGGLPVQKPVSAREYSTLDSEGSVVGTDSESDLEYHEDDRRRYRESATITRRRSRSRASRNTSRHSRPGMSHAYTTPEVSTRSRSRERVPVDYMHRAPHSDTGVEYLDPERAAIPRRRGTVSSTRSSRRPSVSTTASSGRTPATTLSNSSSEYPKKVIIEDHKGRRIAYLSKEQISHLRRQETAYQEQIRAKDDATAYQNATGLGEPFELTADNIRRRQHRTSGSHTGSVRSHRSTGSKASRTSKTTEGVIIEIGGASVHVVDEQIQILQGEDGGPTRIVMNSSTTTTANGRDSGYHTSSRSSGSRRGRSQTHVYRDADGYEDDRSAYLRYENRRL